MPQSLHFFRFAIGGSLSILWGLSYHLWDKLQVQSLELWSSFPGHIHWHVHWRILRWLVEASV